MRHSLKQNQQVVAARQRCAARKYSDSESEEDAHVSAPVRYAQVDTPDSPPPPTQPSSGSAHAVDEKAEPSADVRSIDSGGACDVAAFAQPVYTVANEAASSQTSSTTSQTLATPYTAVRQARAATAAHPPSTLPPAPVHTTNRASDSAVDLCLTGLRLKPDLVCISAAMNQQLAEHTGVYLPGAVNRRPSGASAVSTPPQIPADTTSVSSKQIDTVPIETLTSLPVASTSASTSVSALDANATVTSPTDDQAGACRCNTCSRCLFCVCVTRSSSPQHTQSMVAQ